MSDAELIRLLRIDGHHEAANRIEELLAERRWVSVEEQLPELMEWVLCACKNGEVKVLRYDHIMDDWDFAVIRGHGYSLPRDSVTHWMPLPNPPRTEVE